MSVKKNPRPFVIYDLPRPSPVILEPVYNFFTPDERVEVEENQFQGFAGQVQGEVYVKPNGEIIKEDNVKDRTPRFVKIHLEEPSVSDIGMLNIPNQLSNTGPSDLNFPELSNSPYDISLLFNDSTSYKRTKNKISTLMKLKGFSEGAESEESVESFFASLSNIPSNLKNKIKDNIDYDLAAGVSVNSLEHDDLTEFYKNVQSAIYRGKVDVRYMTRMVGYDHQSSTLRNSVYQGWIDDFNPAPIPKTDSPLLKDVTLVPAGHPTQEDSVKTDYDLSLVGYIIERYSGLSTILDNKPDAVYKVDSPSGGTFIDTEVLYGIPYTYTVRYVFKVSYGIPDQFLPDKSTRYTNFLTSVASDPASTSIIDREPPDEPEAVFYRFNFMNKKGLFITWQLPTTPQRDVKYFQIFRRTSMDEPFTCIGEIDFDNSFIKTARTEKVREDKVIKKRGSFSFFEDPDFKNDSSFIYAVAAVDAHGFTSGYSAQTRVSFIKHSNSLSLTPISMGGAPKQYPNFYMDPDEDPNTFVNTITQDTIKTSGFKKLTIYFDPDARYINQSELEGVKHLFPCENGGSNFSPNSPEGVFKMTFLDIDRQKSKTLEIGITEAPEEIFS